MYGMECMGWNVWDEWVPTYWNDVVLCERAYDVPLIIIIIIMMDMKIAWAK